jgi:hypothetical protein
MTKTKVTLSIEEYQKEFVDEIGINMSKLLRKVIDSQIEDITGEELELLRRVNGKGIDDSRRQEMIDELTEAGINPITRD